MDAILISLTFVHSQVFHEFIGFYVSLFDNVTTKINSSFLGDLNKQCGFSSIDFKNYATDPYENYTTVREINLNERKLFYALLPYFPSPLILYKLYKKS